MNKKNVPLPSVAEAAAIQMDSVANTLEVIEMCSISVLGSEQNEDDFMKRLLPSALAVTVVAARKAAKTANKVFAVLEGSRELDEDAKGDHCEMLAKAVRGEYDRKEQEGEK